MSVVRPFIGTLGAGRLGAGLALAAAIGLLGIGDAAVPIARPKRPAPKPKPRTYWRESRASDRSRKQYLLKGIRP